jgi:hypothetical protein
MEGVAGGGNYRKGELGGEEEGRSSPYHYFLDLNRYFPKNKMLTAKRQHYKSGNLYTYS